MDSKPDPINTLQQDDLLRPVIDAVGRKDLIPAQNFFRRFTVSIIRQQISMDAADAIYESIEERIDIEADILAELSPSDVTDCGVSQMKAETIIRIAKAFHSGNWNRAYFSSLSDEEVIDEMTRMRGVGPWTAKMQLIHSLGREDIYPLEDLGIRKGIETLTGSSLDREDMRQIGDRWRPYRSYASLYIWTLVD